MLVFCALSEVTLKRRLSPADKATGADHEAFQVSPASATVCRFTIKSLFHIPYPNRQQLGPAAPREKRAFAVWREISKTGGAPCG